MLDIALTPLAKRALQALAAAAIDPGELRWQELLVRLRPITDQVLARVVNRLEDEGLVVQEGWDGSKHARVRLTQPGPRAVRLARLAIGGALMSGQLRHDLASIAEGELVQYRVVPCEPDPDPHHMPPVVLVARVATNPAFTLQDYFTPDDADALAAALRTAAQRARVLAAERNGTAAS